MIGVDERTEAWLLMQIKPDRVPATQVSCAAVETGAICNLRCPFCRTGNGTMALEKKFLTQDGFEKILERLGPQLNFLALLRWGEPLLNPQIFGIVQQASAANVATLMHSSLSLPSFDSRAAERTVSSGLRELTVSCDGASQGVYQQYRAGGRFKLVMRNLKLLLEARRRLGSTTPKIRWQFLVHRGNQHEMRTAARMAERLGIGIEFRRLWAPDPWTLEPDAVKIAFPKKPNPLFEYQPCLQIWDMPGVHSDGSVYPCCVVTDAKYSLGNIFHEPMDAIWNKPLAVAMRRYLRSGVKSNMTIPCYNCPRDPNRKVAA